MPSSVLFGLVGRPLMHSLSPAMHAAAYRARHLDASYVRVVAEDAVEALALCRAAGMAGFNVTAPFKEQICALVEPRAEARRIGAVNTVLLRRGRAVGLNTDAPGFLRALAEHKVRPERRSALVLGAGGAARAAAFALVEAGARVTIVNRTFVRAESLARELGCHACGLEPDRLRALTGEAEIVVGAVSAKSRLVEPGWLAPDATVFDAVYGWRTPLVDAAEKRGCRVIDGREWLLYQGAEAFEAFTGERAPVAAMRRAIHCPAPSAPDGVALVGFMAAGKSTVARELERIAGLAATDLDQRIEQRAGQTIPEIFRSHGEPHFRRLERQEVASLVGARGCVIAAGGGTALDRRNVEILRQGRLVAWLWVGPRGALGRNEKGTRPLLADGTAAKRLLESRRGAYARACDVMIGTEGRSPERVAELVLECFREVARC